MSTPTVHELAGRVAALEALVINGGRASVSGWEAAARVLQKSVPTVKRLARHDPAFPRPIRMNAFRRRGRSKPCFRPEWCRSDLINYINS